MNQIIVELTLSAPSKEQAVRVIQLVQATCGGGTDPTIMGAALHSMLAEYVDVVSAGYRERRESD